MLYLKILDNLQSGILFIDKNKKVKYMNRAAKHLFGDKVGGGCSGIFSICKACPFENLKKKPQVLQNFDVKVACCEKTVCHSITPVYENGEFLGVIEEFRDATQLINNFYELKKQKEFTDTILNSVVDGILVVDENGVILHYNESAKEVICREIDDIAGMDIETVLGVSLESLPPNDVREDVHIETPAIGKTKASVMKTPLKDGEGYLISFHILPECLISNGDTKGRMISKNPKFLSIIEMAKTVADTTASILIEGETGTGKSKLAQWIHNLSSRRTKPFIKINCAAIPETLLESELFGYVKGAFTGANKDKPGKVELAEGGTLFLDEIGDMPVYLQSKLLHLIQEKEFERLGDVKTRKANIRIIAATNKDLKQLIKEGKFREDLYYRLKVISLNIPALRERKEDIPYLIDYFIEKYSKTHNRKITSISPEAIKILIDYDYPGNIRELENIIERAVIICDKDQIQPIHLPEELKEKVKSERVFYEEKSSLDNNTLSERELILQVLRETKGNKTLAAKILGMHRTTLWRKIKEYNIN